MNERYVKLEDAQSVVFNILKEAAVNSDNDEMLSVLAHCSAEIFLELFAISNTEEPRKTNGRWLQTPLTSANQLDYRAFMCSVCNHSQSRMSNYCPFCGCKMEEKNDLES